MYSCGAPNWPWRVLDPFTAVLRDVGRSEPSFTLLDGLGLMAISKFCPLFRYVSAHCLPYQLFPWPHTRRNPIVVFHLLDPWKFPLDRIVSDVPHMFHWMDTSLQPTACSDRRSDILFLLCVVTNIWFPTHLVCANIHSLCAPWAKIFFYYGINTECISSSYGAHVFFITVYIQVLFMQPVSNNNRTSPLHIGKATMCNMLFIYVCNGRFTACAPAFKVAVSPAVMKGRCPSSYLFQND